MAPRSAIKGQVVAGFIDEFTLKGEFKQGEKKQEEDGTDTDKEWQLYVDGASNSRDSGTSIVFITLEGTVIESAVTLGFTASNNEAEYETLLSGLRIARELGIKWLIVHCDS
ncbi:hypothetical protein MRB53_001903 [Persea americana]|uniref:Uncharacterized protein n=1 Tax=Persea americana TaxID=3435 RepID=A0ACC2MT18_PERAE|nr:hypothetical protein MRB53_001903 [Persea americana]